MTFMRNGAWVFLAGGDAEEPTSTAVNPLAIRDQWMSRAEAIELVGRDPHLLYVVPGTDRVFHTRPTMSQRPFSGDRPTIAEGWCLNHLAPKWAKGRLVQVHPLFRWPLFVELPRAIWNSFGLHPPKDTGTPPVVLTDDELAALAEAGAPQGSVLTSFAEEVINGLPPWKGTRPRSAALRNPVPRHVVAASGSQSASVIPSAKPKAPRVVATKAKPTYTVGSKRRVKETGQKEALPVTSSPVFDTDGLSSNRVKSRIARTALVVAAPIPTNSGERSRVRAKGTTTPASSKTAASGTDTAPTTESALPFDVDSVIRSMAAPPALRPRDPSPETVEVDDPMEVCAEVDDAHSTSLGDRTGSLFFRRSEIPAPPPLPTTVPTFVICRPKAAAADLADPRTVRPRPVVALMEPVAGPSGVSQPSHGWEPRQPRSYPAQMERESSSWWEENPQDPPCHEPNYPEVASESTHSVRSAETWPKRKRGKRKGKGSVQSGPQKGAPQRCSANVPVAALGAPQPKKPCPAPAVPSATAARKAPANRKAKRARREAARTPFFTELEVFVTFDRPVGQLAAYLNVGSRVPGLLVRDVEVQATPSVCSRRTDVQS